MFRHVDALCLLPLTMYPKTHTHTHTHIYKNNIVVALQSESANQDIIKPYIFAKKPSGFTVRHSCLERFVLCVKLTYVTFRHIEQMTPTSPIC